MYSMNVTELSIDMTSNIHEVLSYNVTGLSLCVCVCVCVCVCMCVCVCVIRYEIK